MNDFHAATVASLNISEILQRVGSESSEHRTLEALTKLRCHLPTILECLIMLWNGEIVRMLPLKSAIDGFVVLPDKCVA